MIELLQEIIAAIGTIYLPIFMLDSISEDEKVIVSYKSIISQTDDYISNDMIYISVFLNKLSFNGKSIHDIQRLDSICTEILHNVNTYLATNKLYNITYLGKPIVRTQEETDKSEALIVLQITTKTNL